MRQMHIYTVDEILKSMSGMVSQVPPKAIPRKSVMHPSRAQAKDYMAPKRTGHPSETKKVGQAFSIDRKKGPEEAKVYRRAEAREKAEERESEKQAYGKVVTERGHEW